METSAPARCKRHPEALAGWTCHGCEAALCPECVVTRRAQTAEFLVCLPCGGTATPLLLHRRATPFARRVLGAWRYPFQVSNLLFLVAVSVPLAFFGWMTDASVHLTKLVPSLIGTGIFWTALFAIIRGSAQGKGEVEPPDFSGLWSDLLAPGMRGLLATSVVWLPGVLYLLYLRDEPGLDAGPESLWGDPFLWALVLAGAVYMPMLLMTAAAGASVWGLLNPVGNLGRIRHLGRDYLLAVGTLLLLLVPHALAHLLAAGLRSLDIFLISRTLAECLTNVVPFLMAHVLGLLLYTRGDDVGYGLAQDYLEPVLGSVKPHAQPEALRASEPGPQAPPLATAELASLAKAVEARDVAQALGLYPALQAVPEARRAMDPAHHLFVGQAAATQGDYPLAVQALEAAADLAPDSPTAPRALVLLARVYGERLQETERAEGIYRYIVHRYPDTDASRFAQQRIPADAPGS